MALLFSATVPPIDGEIYNTRRYIIELIFWTIRLPIEKMVYFIIIIIIIKRGWQCKAGREQLTPYQSENTNPTTPTHRKKEEKGKTVGHKKRASS